VRVQILIHDAAFDFFLRNNISFNEWHPGKISPHLNQFSRVFCYALHSTVSDNHSLLPPLSGFITHQLSEFVTAAVKQKLGEELFSREFQTGRNIPFDKAIRELI